MGGMLKANHVINQPFLVDRPLQVFSTEIGSWKRL